MWTILSQRQWEVSPTDRSPTEKENGLKVPLYRYMVYYKRAFCSAYEVPVRSERWKI